MKEKRIYLTVCIQVPIGYKADDVKAEVEHVLQAGMTHPERIQAIGVEAQYPA